MPKLPVNQINRGNAVILNNEIFLVVSKDHVKPGKGPAYLQTKLRNLESGKIIEQRLRTADTMEVIDVDRQTCMYSYKNGENFVFMNNDSYEELELHETVLGDDGGYLLEGNNVVLMVADGRVLGVELPPNVQLTITECDPGVKNATATNVFKNAIVETGITVQVPPFINQGDVVKVSTEDGSYIERVSTGK